VKRIDETPSPATKQADHDLPIRGKRGSRVELENRRNCRGRPAQRLSRGLEHRGIRRRERVSMIRHTFCGPRLRRCQGLALAVRALAFEMIEAAFLGLLMAAVGGAALKPAGVIAADLAAVNLPLITMRADEEDNAATWRAARALPERSVTIIRHVWPRPDGQPRPKVGKCRSNRGCASETEHPIENPGCLRSRGSTFSSRSTMLTKGHEEENAFGDEAVEFGSVSCERTPSAMRVTNSNSTSCGTRLRR